MIEIIGLILISRLFIWLFQKENLSVLGLSFSIFKMKYSGVLFTLTVICCLSSLIMRMYFAEVVFIINPRLSLSLIFAGIWLTFKSVLFGELLTRGVLLYILIKRLGVKWAIFILSLFFGLLHLNKVTSDNVIIEILLTFLYPFLFSLVMAYSFAKSFSIYLPFAIHFGWNIVENFLLPNNLSTDKILLIQKQPIITVSYFVFFLMLLFPKISAIISAYLVVAKINKKSRHIIAVCVGEV